MASRGGGRCITDMTRSISNERSTRVRSDRNPRGGNKSWKSALRTMRVGSHGAPAKRWYKWPHTRVPVPFSTKASGHSSHQCRTATLTFRKKPRTRPREERNKALDQHRKQAVNKHSPGGMKSCRPWQSPGERVVESGEGEEEARTDKKVGVHEDTISRQAS